MSNTVTLAAVGDISLKGETGLAARSHGPGYPFGAIQAILDSADLRFGNLESIFYPSDFPAEELSARALVAADDLAPVLAEARLDIVNLAQNHILDAGTLALEHTQGLLAAMGIAHGGAGLSSQQAHRPAVLTCRGLRLGFLAYQEDCNYTHGHIGAGPAYLEEHRILADMALLRDQVDILVLSLHSDLEFMDTPAVWRKALSHRLVAAGADLILHTHPHVPQGIEQVGRSLIVYSLGNCIFDAHGNPYMKNNGPHTAHSFVLTVQLDRGGVVGFQRHPFTIPEAPGPRPVPMTGAAVAEGLRYLEWLDAQVADDAVVLRNWRAICMTRLGKLLRDIQGLDAETFMERHAFVLAGVQENRAWTSELVTMAQERFHRQAAADKDFLAHHRPSWEHEGRP